MRLAKKVILGITGSIAAYKSIQLVRDLTAAGIGVQVVLTEAARHFVSPLPLQVFSGAPVISNLFDPQGAVVHLGLQQEADLILIAPATADFMAKAAAGLAEDLLGALLLSTRVPVLMAPAMDLGMWAHPAVVCNVALLRERGIEMIDPEVGPLASGCEGMGRLANLSVILDRVNTRLSAKDLLKGEVVLVTAGPTREEIDPTRFISNASSGKMGYALASAASYQGARVILISGPTTLPKPGHVCCVEVKTAEEMEKAVDQYFPESTIVIMAAAVSDFRPKSAAASKVKKKNHPLLLELMPTPDILKGLQPKKQNRFFVGFAAETEALIDNAKAKLRDKGLDLIVANNVSEAGAGFENDTNIVHLIRRGGEVTSLPKMSKRHLADVILSEVVRMKASIS